MKPQSNSQHSAGGRGTPGSSGNRAKFGTEFKAKVTCTHCKRPGHTMTQCYFLKGRQDAQKQQQTASNTVGCAVSLESKKQVSQIKKQEVPQKGGETDKVCEEFEPFVLEGVVSLGDNGSPKPIKIVRDTCCARSMILEGTLPFNEDSSAGNALIQGIGMEIISVPLHKINLTSDLVSGPVTIGVRHELPVKGVSMLLGNDLAGGEGFS